MSETEGDESQLSSFPGQSVQDSVCDSLSGCVSVNLCMCVQGSIYSFLQQSGRRYASIKAG